MIPYPSIESLFKRCTDKEVCGDRYNKLEFDKVRDARFLDVFGWDVQEKVDGTNIRLITTAEGVEVRGRTDKAQFSPKQLEFLKGLLNPEEAIEILAHPTKEDWAVTIYGELYGPGVQKGGIYRPDLGFRAFDIRFGRENGRWGEQEELADVAEELGIDTVPSIGSFTNGAEVPTTKREMDAFAGMSVVAGFENDTETRMEGIVARPWHVLLDAFGNRVMWKLTYRDLDDDDTE